MSSILRLLAREPHATAERRLELEREAHQLTRPLPLYTDFTTSFQKSISLLHASIRENARRAREAGDQDEAAHWDAQERKFMQILKDAHAQVVRHLEEWAGYTRTGSHARRIHGEETGRWEGPAWSALAGRRARAGMVTHRITFTESCRSSA
jgi:hypothetical protein